jgi:hypothetical protein
MVSTCKERKFGSFSGLAFQKNVQTLQEFIPNVGLVFDSKYGAATTSRLKML